MTPSRAHDGPVRVGSIRPSQAVHSYGVGSLIDLPSLSVMVGGLDRWDITRQAVVTEDRLLDAVRGRVGPQVEVLRALPAEPQTTNNPYDDWARVGVPVTVFPRWLRCTACNRLFPVSSGALKLDHNPYRIDWTRYTHPNCDRAKRPPPAVPARFVAGCAEGHLDEFPWVRFAHDGKPTCSNPILRVNDVGSGGRATDLLVTCLSCDARSTLAKAFGPVATEMMPRCRGRHPHLGLATEPCTEQLRTMVLGASNLWFNASVSVLSLPAGGGSLGQLVYDHWAAFAKMPVKEVLTYALSSDRALAAAFAGYDLDEVWDAVEARRAGSAPPSGVDVRAPEWAALTAGSQGQTSPHFEAEPVDAPAELSTSLAGVTLAHRLRVVTALYGFTRISAGEPGDGRAVVRLEAKGAPTWVPVVENRGEGILVRLHEAAVQAWESTAFDDPLFVAMRRAHREWRQARSLDPNEGWPGERFVLLHSLSHALINELAIECGYSSASISERIYSRGPHEGPTPMAGILLYTSAPDAEGTLGGLVHLGQASELGPILGRVLDRAGLCSSDPLCADHEPAAATSAIHGAACHACLLVAETSCERGNRYLDRSVLVDTFRHAGLGFFG
ncbi:MAG: DrmB family protein [Acidimicrobiales bacterium]